MHENNRRNVKGGMRAVVAVKRACVRDRRISDELPWDVAERQDSAGFGDCYPDQREPLAAVVAPNSVVWCQSLRAPYCCLEQAVIVAEKASTAETALRANSQTLTEAEALRSTVLGSRDYREIPATGVVPATVGIPASPVAEPASPVAESVLYP